MTTGGTLQNPIKKGALSSQWAVKALQAYCTFFYLGKIPKAPGTAGTIGAIPLVYFFFSGGEYFYLIATMVLVLISIYLCEIYEKTFQTHDDSQIVIDEVAGFLIAMALIPMTVQAFALGFVLFRVLDITKPLLIGTIDKKIKGGLGVMADDILAGLVTNIVLQMIYLNTNWLGTTLEYQAGVLW